ncbi:CPBP family intramembrane glutamic endopeptidase [Paenibacillus hexagrammi]|uniref:CPBP family intramembrane metalloprotease n=1 Tax=Paenibacillus hexagrammi TaxID=2908839 RepID=A0ABY3SIY4_9BACL|nr:type II CAAX endopeptidase family protein [Paenibacillus sp. YPD9-1]UJF33872.1 CPBP family intramembrane metalloprotease [Paenibacillus sp. YPD9-1]
MTLWISILLIGLLPVIGWICYRQLPQWGRIKFYLFMIAWYWLLTGYLFAAHSQKQVLQTTPVSLPLMLKWMVWTVIVVWALWELLPILMSLVSPRYREMVAANLDITDSMPVTAAERSMFLLVAVTVGFCEELISRGMLPALLQDGGLPYWLGFVVAGLHFAVGHFLQGWRGIANAALLALMFTMLYVMTGSLVIPILLHALYDYRLVLISKLQQNKPQAESLEQVTKGT